MHRMLYALCRALPTNATETAIATSRSAIHRNLNRCFPTHILIERCAKNSSRYSEVLSDSPLSLVRWYRKYHSTNDEPENSKSVGDDKDTTGAPYVWPLIFAGGVVYVLSSSKARERVKAVFSNIDASLGKWQSKMNSYFTKNSPMMSSLPLLPSVEELQYPPGLPTLVVDADSMLFKMKYNRKCGWRAKRRPGAEKFLQELGNYYEIVVWSDDSFPLAQDVMNVWNPPIVGCLHREQCETTPQGLVKDIGRLGRDLSRVVHIDHDTGAVGRHKENSIILKAYNGEEDDVELYTLLDFLKDVALSGVDVRQAIAANGGGNEELGRRYLAKKNALIKRSAYYRSWVSWFGLDTLARPSVGAGVTSASKAADPQPNA